MKKIYLGTVVIGAIVPFYFFFQFIQLNGVSLSEFILALFANGAVGDFTADLLISSFVFWTFMFRQREISKAPNPSWVFIVLNFGTGLSCALPAYLNTNKSLHNPYRA